MGHVYDSSGRLCCDKCGKAGAKAIRCTFKVDGLPYCYPPDLCDECTKELGGRAKIHEKCKDKAAARQAECDVTRARIESGDSLLSTAWGDWHDKVPEGKVGLRFAGKDSETYILVDSDEHDRLRKEGKMFLSEFESARYLWLDHPDTTTKQVG